MNQSELRTLFQSCDEEVTAIIMRANISAMRRGHNRVTVEDFLLAALDGSSASVNALIAASSLDVAAIKTELELTMESPIWRHNVSNAAFTDCEIVLLDTAIKTLKLAAATSQSESIDGKHFFLACAESNCSSILTRAIALIRTAVLKS